MTASRRRALGAFYAANRDRLGAPIGASDCHFGGRDLGRALTAFEGRSAADFRRAVEAAKTRPVPGKSRPVPLALAARQQWQSLVRLPLRRLRGRF
jgi:hypothetical protein